MKYAPILIPTLCRYTHLVRLIQSLQKNSWAGYTDVYVGVDFPPSPKYEEGYQNICRYLEGEFPEFASFNVIKHSHNVGSFGNMEKLREIVFKKYDRFIRTDDDAEFSPNFIEYMDKCLMQYEGDSNVIAVTGYSYPVKWRVSDNATIFKENFICPMWGTGFWVNKYQSIKEEIGSGCLHQSVDYVFRKNIMDRMLEVCKDEYVNLCLSPVFTDTLACKMSDVALRMYTAINDKYVVCPVCSKVRNWGFDGSGEYCGKIFERNTNKLTAFNYPYHLQVIDKSKYFNLTIDSLNAIEKNREILDKFQILPFKSKVKYIMKKYVYLIFGRKVLFNFCKLKRKK